MREKLVEWALSEIGHEAMESRYASVDLKGTLKGVGFEYSVQGGTVEITLESVVETLSNMVGPELRNALQQD